MKIHACVVACLLLVLPGALCPAEEGGGAGLAALETQFRELPLEARRLIGPLFWLHGDESPERLAAYVQKVAEGGNGCFTAESRPHKDWLGPGWYRDLAVCLEAAKKHDLKMWIFDEKWWPSGEVGGKVPPIYGCKRLVAAARDVAGPARLVEEGCTGPHFIAVVAGKVAAGGIDGSSLLDLSNSIREGTLQWNAPPGSWKVMKFTWELSKGRRILVDGASRDCVDWYIRTVYQPHYDRFAADFGRTIAGYFYDEPETPGDWGTEVMKVLAERKVDWKKALVAWKFTLAGPEQAAARYQYQDAFSEAWGRTLYGGLTRWCREHHVRSIGHFLEHNWEYLHPRLCAGNMFQLQKYSSMGAIDAVFRQFAPGKRDPGLWQTPKIASSISHAYGKLDDISMVEIFGARGQDLSYPEMKWWTDHMQVCGVNFMIPHSFNPRSPRDTDCPPYFYNSGFEARWPLYRVYADYTSRLSLLLSGGRHVCPAAFLFLGGSRHVGRSVLPEGMTTALQDALFDCDWIPYEVFENDMTISGKELKLRRERYRLLIVPPVEVIPHATLLKARKFFDSGGIVLGYGFLPSKSATLGKTPADISAVVKSIWGNPEPGLKACRTSAGGGRSYLLPEKPSPEDLRKAITADAGIHPALEVIDGDTGGRLHVLHRAKAGSDIFLICNQVPSAKARKFRLRFAAEGRPESWDALRGEITAIPFRREGKHVDLSLTLEPLESVLVVFRKARRDLPVRLDPGAGRVLASVPLTRIPAPPKEAPVPEKTGEDEHDLSGCAWIWYPEGNPAASAPPGTRYFRKRIVVPAGRKVGKATFYGTADNDFTLFVNGKKVGKGDGSDLGWRHPVELDLRPFLRPGANQFAVAAVNATDAPSPAGMVGRIRIAFEQGKPVVESLDATWITSRTLDARWKEADFDASGWVPSREVARFGQAPWGRLSGSALTLSGIEADPFLGRCRIPADLDLHASRVYLQLDDLKPEAAASVTVNGAFAGGFIGRPLRLDVTRLLKIGDNTIGIEPFAPPAARLVFYAK